jgi:hypothetical protein
VSVPLGTFRPMGRWPTWAEASRRRDRAIELRLQGMSYKQIRSVVGGSMASLSKWLRDIPLTDLQRAGLRRRRLEAVQRTARANHERRLVRDAEIRRTTADDIGSVSDRDLFVAGVIAYGRRNQEEALAEQHACQIHQLRSSDDFALSSLAIACWNRAVVDILPCRDSSGRRYRRGSALLVGGRWHPVWAVQTNHSEAREPYNQTPEQRARLSRMPRCGGAKELRPERATGWMVRRHGEQGPDSSALIDAVRVVSHTGRA